MGSTGSRTVLILEITDPSVPFTNEPRSMFKLEKPKEVTPVSRFHANSKIPVIFGKLDETRLSPITTPTSIAYFNSTDALKATLGAFDRISPIDLVSTPTFSSSFLLRSIFNDASANSSTIEFSILFDNFAPSPAKRPVIVDSVPVSFSLTLTLIFISSPSGKIR